jgi:AGZA family xanthine/uracil permease-like MFS transporter
MPAPQPAPPRGSLDRLFHLSDHRTTVRTEVLAGVTTFLTMAYIIFVQPAVLSTDFAGKPTGLDFGAVLLATCLASAATSIFMGLYAGYPIALAPGMGENFFFVSVIMTIAASGTPDAWRTALGLVFVSGVIFLALSLAGVREAIIDAISRSLRSAIAAGIGLFISFIGLRNAGVIVGKPGTLVGLTTQVASADVAVFTAGFLVAAVLQVRRVRGAVLWGVLASAAGALAAGQIHLTGVFGFPHIVRHAAFQMDVPGALHYALVPFIIVFVFMNVFDTVGTLIGVAEQAGLVVDDKLPRASRVLTVDAAGTVLGACLGTSTIVTFIESAAGVSAGGRTGLTSVVTGVLFLAALVFSPIIGAIGNYPPITAPALVLVGVMMMQSVTRIAWDDFSEAIPAFLIVVGIPLSYSIADGLALGFITYPLLKLLAGRRRDAGPLSYVMAALLVAYFVFVRARL